MKWKKLTNYTNTDINHDHDHIVDTDQTANIEIKVKADIGQIVEVEVDTKEITNEIIHTDQNQDQKAINHDTADTIAAKVVININNL